MNAIWLAVFLSGVLNNPVVLMHEKDYIREYGSLVEWNEQFIEIYLERGYNHGCLGFVLEEEFGKRGRYIMDWIDQQQGDQMSDSHIRDYEVIEITIDNRLVRLEKRRGTMVLSYERSKG
jgi:hypothetical protein